MHISHGWQQYVFCICRHQPFYTPLFMIRRALVIKKNTLSYKIMGKLGSFSSKYTLAISKYKVPLLAL
jgi:hypothetical protein